MYSLYFVYLFILILFDYKLDLMTDFKILLSNTTNTFNVDIMLTLAIFVDMSIFWHIVPQCCWFIFFSSFLKVGNPYRFFYQTTDLLIFKR